MQTDTKADPLRGATFDGDTYLWPDGSFAERLPNFGTWVACRKVGDYILDDDERIMEYPTALAAAEALRAAGYGPAAVEPSGWVEGARLIAAERQRQVEKEGWTPEHDDMHDECELSEAAKCYIIAAKKMARERPRALDMPASWPWAWHWFKPSYDPVRNLVKAGALIAAEIDRLLRAKSAPEIAAEIDRENGEKLREQPQENSMETWPKDWPRTYNACNDPCDMLVGPCACGSTHGKGEYTFVDGELCRYGKPPAVVDHSNLPEQPAPVGREKLPEEIRGLYDSYKMSHARERWYPSDNRVKFLAWAEATYDCSAPPKPPDKPAPLEPFLIENSKTGATAWANCDSGSSFYFVHGDGNEDRYVVYQDWRRVKETPCQ